MSEAPPQIPVGRPDTLGSDKDRANPGRSDLAACCRVRGNNGDKQAAVRLEPLLLLDSREWAEASPPALRSIALDLLIRIAGNCDDCNYGIGSSSWRNRGNDADVRRALVCGN